MKLKVLYIVLFLLCSVVTKSFSQGCSDPGICTIGTLNSETTKDTVSGIDYTEAELEELLSATYASEKVRFEVGGIIAQGDHGVQYFGGTITLAARLKKKMLLSVKLPINYAQGSLGSNIGLGDLTISLQNTFYSGKDKRLSATLGLVVPTGNANAMDKGFALPMAYQTTLGSFNALIGISGTYKKWGAVFGFQYSFGQNGNTFYQEDLGTDETVPNYDPLNLERKKYTSSQSLQRGSDLILRIERRFDIGKKFGIAIGVLPIYRLNKSRITDNTGQEVVVNGTDGITLNLTGGIRYAPSRNWLIRLNYGSPVITRKVRADGLTRKYVGVLSVAYRLW